jgi:hypothetical protein
MGISKWCLLLIKDFISTLPQIKNIYVTPQILQSKLWFWMDTFQKILGFISCPYGPDIISVTSCKCVIHFEGAQLEFWHTGNTTPQANWSQNKSCFNNGPTLVSTSRKHRTPKYVTKDLKFETYHLLKHAKFWWVARHKFQCPGSSRLEHTTHRKFWELCFGATHAYSMCPM